MQMVIAWIKKYIFHVKSPSVKWLGYDYEWDYMREVNADAEGMTREEIDKEVAE